MQKRCNGAKRNGIFSKCLHWICKYYAFQRNATTPNSPIMAKSHPAGMHICYGIFAGISLRLCSISLRSFRITFTAYLPTHIKFLTEFRRIVFGTTSISFQKKNGRNAHGCGYALNPSTHIVSVSHFAPPSSLALLAARRPKRP